MSNVKRRRVAEPYDSAFKLKVVQEVLVGGRSQAEVCREYQVIRQTVRRWTQAYQRQGEAAFASPATKGRPRGPRAIAGLHEEPKALPKGTQARLAELERLCGRLALENELFKKVLGRAPLANDTP